MSRIIFDTMIMIIFDTISGWLMEKLDIWSNARDDDNVDDGDDELDGQNDCCPICLGEDADNLHATLCGHVFHQGCLEVWLAMGRKTCPVCRGNVGPGHYYFLDWVIP